MHKINFIVVEGPIGVGKTTLAGRLADTLQAELLLEQPAENPFLPRFYRNPAAAALSTQLHFLLQRTALITNRGQPDMFRKCWVADFMLEKDPLFAAVTLDAHELHLYQALYQQLSINAPKPDLVIYLQAPVPVLLERIERRGVSYETDIDAEYLQRLSEAYTQYFFDYSATPLLIVNAAAVDFSASEPDYQALLRQLQHVGPGKQYFNPSPLG